MENIIIGIAGPSGSGKTTVAEKIEEFLTENDHVVVISFDDYYRRNDHMSFEKREKLNYDHPNSIEMELLLNDLKELKANRSIEKVLYDFVNHNRSDKTELVEPKKIIILEGLFTLVEKDIRDLLDIKIYVDTDSDICFIRRLTRDVNARGRTIESVIEQFTKYVKPMREQFIEPSKKYADIIIPSGGENTVAINMVITQIENLIKGRK